MEDQGGLQMPSKWTKEYRNAYMREYNKNRRVKWSKGDDEDDGILDETERKELDKDIQELIDASTWRYKAPCKIVTRKEIEDEKISFTNRKG
jgi:hypothetical protein